MKHAACYKKGYPRPRFVRESFVSLNGEWDFAFDRGGAFLADKMRTAVFPQKIVVPFAYNSPSSGIEGAADCDTVWYRRTFRFCKSAKKRVLLHFDGADYFSDVWLNGRYLGKHEGGYTRFTFDITDALRTDNILLVRCADPFDPAYPRGKQRHLDHRTGCFYEPTVGLWKDVWLEEVGQSSLSDVFSEIRFADSCAILHYRVRNFRPGLRFCATAYYDGDKVASVSSEVSAQEGRVLLELENRKQQLPVKAWSAGACGQFFDVVYELFEQEKRVDLVRSYTALTEYRADGDRILFNYLPNTYLRMVLAQGYYPGGELTGTEEQMERDVQLIKEAGFNGVRMHQKLEDERFYYFCDMAGLYVWCEMPSAYVSDERTVHALQSQAEEALIQYRGYHSVMAFVMFNENWGAQQVFANERLQAMVNSAYWLAKALAPGKLVIGNDGWEHTETDIVTLHNYAQEAAQLAEACSDTEHFLRGGRVRDLHTRTAFAKGYAYRGQPVLMSEFGGVKYAQDQTSWGYGAAASAEEFAARLADLVAALSQNRAIAGYCLTQFTDVWQERNGLFTQTREPKISLERMREINNQ